MKRILSIVCVLSFAFAAWGQTEETVHKVIVKHLTEAEFLQKVANYKENPHRWEYLGDKPCIVDFYASWCEPCKALAPILEELANEYAGKIYVYKVDTEQERGLSAAFGIQAIPTMLFCPLNAQPQIAQGMLPKEQLKMAIEQVLLKK